MKNKRFRNYVENQGKTKTAGKYDVIKNGDAKTFEDYPGFPNGQSSEKMINPDTKTERAVASMDIKDGDKMTDEEKTNAQNKVAETKEALSDGSGGAFSGTEGISDQH